MARQGIFISYSRKDGKDYAADLRRELEAAGFDLWQDVIGMEGGKNFWGQITGAIDNVAYMVLVATPFAMQSEYVQNEWRYARQQGVCVYPVLVPDHHPNFDAMPCWMRMAHFYDRTNPDQAQRFLNDLRTRCTMPRVVKIADKPPQNYVGRSTETDALVSALLNTTNENVGVVLVGAGGYGKTTLAQKVCDLEKIKVRFDGGILWVTLGEKPTSATEMIQGLVKYLKPDAPNLGTSLHFARRQLGEILDQFMCGVLLVVDDVWKAEDLRPFSDLSRYLALMVTTRNNAVLTDWRVPHIQIDRMTRDEAVSLLTQGLVVDLSAPLNGQPAHLTFEALAKRLGDWPLLLKLVNDFLLGEMRDYSAHLGDALQAVNEAWDDEGITAFDDPENADLRDRAVRATLQPSLNRLDPTTERPFYHTLGIFPEDADVPLSTVEQLWRALGLTTTSHRLREFFKRLHRSSLLLDLKMQAKTLRLHDVVRHYLRHEQRDHLAAWHTTLLDSYSVTHWADLPPDEPYLWRHLGTHLVAAGRDQEFVALMHNARYLAAKTLAVGPQFVEEDFSLVLGHTPSHQYLKALRDTYVNMTHLLMQCSTLNDALATMHSRIQHVEDLFAMRLYIEKEIQHPYIEALHPLPDLPPYSLARTLVQGRFLTCCAWSPDGTKVVAGGWESSLVVWNPKTLRSEFECRHEQSINDCAWSPDGTRLLSASDDATVRIWDAHQGNLIAALEGHTNRITICAWIMDGNSFVTASDDGTLRIWDTQSTEVRHVLEQGAPITALSCDDSVGKLYVASADGNLTVWSMESGTMMEQVHLENVVSVLAASDRAASDRGGLMLIGMGLEDTPAPKSVVLICRLSNLEFVVSHLIDGWVSSGGWSYDGRFAAVASTSGDVYVLDHLTHLIHPYKGHSQAVNDCEWSPKRHKVLTVSNDGTLKIWRASIDVFKHIQQASASRTWTVSCDFSPNGTRLATYNLYNQATLWDVATGEFTQIGDVAHGQPRSIIWSPDGKKILVASGGTVFVYDAATRVCVNQIELDPDIRITSCTWSTDTAKILVGFQMGRAVLLESSSLSIVWDRNINYQDITGFSWNPTHDEFVVSTGSLVSVMDTTFNTLHVLHDNTHIEDAYWTKTCSWSPDGSYILAVFDNGQICIWGTGDYALFFTIEVNAEYAVWSPTAKQILAVSDDGAIQIWDIAERAWVALVVSSHLKCCAWSPDGTTLAVGGDGGLYVLRWVP